MSTNRTIYRIIFMSALVTSVEMQVAALAIPAAYHVTDLGTLGGMLSYAYGINDIGQVTGTSQTTEYVSAFLWTPTTPNGASGMLQGLEMGALGDNPLVGQGINALGQVTGVTNGIRAFLHDGTTHDLGTLGGFYSAGYAINERGQVTGSSDPAGDGVFHAFVWTPSTYGGTSGTMLDLGTFGGSDSAGYGINHFGQVTGEYTNTVVLADRAFLWTPTTSGGASGTAVDLGTLGGISSRAYAINDRGQVAGDSGMASFFQTPHAFLWTPTTPGGDSGAMLDLGTLGGTSSQAHGINSSGHVVGNSSTNGDAARHAFLHTSGSGMVDLNALIDPQSGWELIEASGINDVGQITGTGKIGGATHAFLLTPALEQSREYRFAGGEFRFDNGETWAITRGEIAMGLFDVLTTEEGQQRAVYGVTAFFLAAVDQLGTSHTITAIPDGMSSPVFHDPCVPDTLLDLGIVDIYPDGLLDLLVYDLSIDGAPVEPLDSIGGPSFDGSTWNGTFPLATDFSVSMQANLGSRTLLGQVTLTGESVPEPSLTFLPALAAIAFFVTLRRRIHFPRWLVCGFIVVSAVFLATANRVRAGMYSVTNVAELISAIDAANQNVGPDSIALAAGTTFTLTEINNTTHGATGLPTITANEILTILGNGSVIERSAASGTPPFRLFDVAAEASLDLENLTLQGGLTSSTSPIGGAINNAGSLALLNVTVQDNIARGRQGSTCSIPCGPYPGGPGGNAFGGGIYSEGTLLLHNSTVSNNQAQGGRGGNGIGGGGPGGNAYGGGLHVAAGTATLYDSIVSGNVALGGVGGNGGTGPPGGGSAGGINISAIAHVGLDAFTLAHVTDNTASTNHPNIFGTYDLIPNSNSLPGDFNHDGTVDAADYIIWRKNPGGIYTQTDYNVWRSHFGQTAGSGSGSISNTAVPEPAIAWLLIVAAAAGTWRRHRPFCVCHQVASA